MSDAVKGDTLVESTQLRWSASSPAASLRILLIVRILTVLNDNLARWLVIGLGKHAADQVGSSHAAVLAIGTVVYVLPFILLAWLSGWLGDRLAKRSVIVAGKFGEIVIAITTAGLAAWGADAGPTLAGIPLGLWLLMGATGLFAVQTTLLNPSLIGTIREIVPAERFAAANGLFAMASLAATLVGMAAGNWLADLTWVDPAGDASLGHALPAASGLIGVAAVGSLVALRLPRVPPADPSAAPPWNVLARTSADIRRLVSSPQLGGAAVGIVVFWAVAAVAQLNVDQYAGESGATTQSEVVPLLVALVSGIGIGSLVSGKLSTRGIEKGSRVDLGFVPLGACVMAMACFALAVSSTEVFVDGTPTWRLLLPMLLLGLLGVGAGMFDVPLEASLQEKSPPGRLAAVLASTNLLVFTGMLLASVGYYGLRLPVGEGELVEPLVSARGVFALFGVLALVQLAVSVYAAPRATLRILVRGLVHLRYRFRVEHDERVPQDGPLVVVANHISWLDGFVVVLACPRPIRMVVFGPNIRGRFLRMLSDQWRFILFDPKPKSIGRALKTIQAGLADGDCIGIFCEGGISRTGQILPFKRGLDWIFGRIEAPITPLSIDGMWGSTLSFSEGTTLSRWPRCLSRRQLTLTYGSCLPAGTPPAVARLALQELAGTAVRRRMLTTRAAERDVRIWSRRCSRQLAAIDERGQHQSAGEVARSWQESGLLATLAGEGVGGLDWAAMAVTAEAFDGGCLLRREDVLLSTLDDDHPLAAPLGQFAGPLLRLRAVWAPHAASAAALCEHASASSATVWLATAEQINTLLSAAEIRLPASLEAIVVPLTESAKLSAFEQAATAVGDRCGLTPVVAFSPGRSAGLLAMNTPPSRNVIAHETTSKPGTLGRVLNGSVFWSTAGLRRSLALADLADVGGCADGEPLVLGAGFAGPRASEPGLVAFAMPGLALDEDAFLHPV